MIHKGLRHLIVGVTTALVLLGTFPSASAVVRDVPANVTLVATLNDGPAMRPVRWKVYRIDNNTETEVRSFLRHSASIVLPPGRYRADANLDSVHRSRVFDVSTRTRNSVVVAMD